MEVFLDWVTSGVILGQNYVWRPDARLHDLLFSKILFYQKQCKYALNIGVAQIRSAL